MHEAADLSTVSIQWVKLPSIWQPLIANVWGLEAALGQADFRAVARRTHAVATDGSRHEVTCLSQHGLERRTPYALFASELAARGWLADATPTHPPSRPPSCASPPCRQLHLIPVVPIPPSMNTSMRTLLVMGLQEAVARSVAAHPPPTASAGPNHFMIVARVCSCFISGDRRPHLGKRARDECSPLRQGSGRQALSQAVRVLSWEQVTPLDRRWSTAPSAPMRRPNLVMPYPSSLLGTDGPKQRPAPWELQLSKPVLAFAAFGVLHTNTSAASAEALLAAYALQCGGEEEPLIAASSCYGKRCRFALRALVTRQLDAGRLPPKQRHRERSCLREAKACPEVMSLTFYAFHDGGEGVGRLSDQPQAVRSAKQGPHFVDDREANDVLAVYRVMLASTFCICLGGDTPTRKSIVDAVMSQCIPVVFQNDSVLMDSLPYRDAVPYERMLHHIPGRAIGSGATQLLQQLRLVPRDVIEAKQALLRRHAPLLAYSYPKLRQGAVRHDERNAVTLAVERLAAEVAPG